MWIKTIALAALLVVGACTPLTVAVDQQRYAGQNTVEAEFVIPEGSGGMESFRAVFAKDCDKCSLTVEIGDGRKLVFHGDGIRGSEHVKTVADSLQALSSNNTEAAKAIAPGALDLLGRIFAPGVPQ